MAVDPTSLGTGLEVTFSGTTERGLTSPLNLSNLPVVNLNAKQALELLENISRDPEGRKLAQFISMQIEAGRRLVVTEDMKLSKFVRIVPQGWEYAGNFDVYDGRVGEISNIKVAKDFILRGDRRGVEGHQYLKDVRGVEVEGAFRVRDTKSGVNIDVTTGKFIADDGYAGMKWQDQYKIKGPLCELGEVKIRASDSIDAASLKCGNFTAQAANDIEANIECGNFTATAGKQIKVDLKAKEVDLISQKSVTLGNVDATSIVVHTESDISRRERSTIRAESVTFEAGYGVRLRGGLEGDYEQRMNQYANKPEHIDIRRLTVVAKNNVTLAHNNCEEIDIFTSEGGIDVSHSPRLRKLRAVTEREDDQFKGLIPSWDRDFVRAGKICVRNSAVSEITRDSQGDWDLLETPNLTTSGPPPRRGLTTAGLGNLFAVDQLAAAVQAQAGALPAGAPRGLNKAKE